MKNKLDIIKKRLKKLIDKRAEYVELAEKDEFCGDDANFYWEKACALWPRIQELELIIDILEN